MRDQVGEDELRVWSINLTMKGVDYDALACLLSADERGRADRFHRDIDRRRFVVTRGALRRILSDHAGVAPAALVFEYGSYGKPALARGCGGGGIRFNLSHSGDVAMCAVTLGHDVGVDVEEIRHDIAIERIGAQFFSHEERQFVSAARNPAEAFTRVWVRKEACLKASGRGIGADLAGFSVIAEGEADASITVRDDGIEWTIQDLPAPTGYLASVATREALKIVMRECAEL